MRVPARGNDNYNGRDRLRRPVRQRARALPRYAPGDSKRMPMLERFHSRGGRQPLRARRPARRAGAHRSSSRASGCASSCWATSAVAVRQRAAQLAADTRARACELRRESRAASATSRRQPIGSQRHADGAASLSPQIQAGRGSLSQGGAVYRPIYLEEATARLRAAAVTTDRPFLERLTCFWTQSLRGLRRQGAGARVLPAASSARRSDRMCWAASRTCCWRSSGIPRCCCISTTICRSVRIRWRPVLLARRRLEPAGGNQRESGARDSGAAHAGCWRRLHAGRCHDARRVS